MLSELFLIATLGTEPDSLRYNGRMGELEVSPPKLVDPGINVDGLLDEQAWTTAAILGGFTQYVPVEGVEPSEATEIRVFYTDEAIYFGIRAYDSDPGEILARFGERDRVTLTMIGSASSWILLTTAGKHTHSQLIHSGCNPTA